MGIGKSVVIEDGKEVEMVGETRWGGCSSTVLQYLLIKFQELTPVSCQW